MGLVSRTGFTATFRFLSEAAVLNSAILFLALVGYSEVLSFGWIGLFEDWVEKGVHTGVGVSLLIVEVYFF